MNDENSKQQMLIHLHNLISEYLDDQVKRPFFETIKKDFFVQDCLADMLIIVNLLVELAYKEGIEFDKDFLQKLSKEEIEKRIDVFGNLVEKYESQSAPGIDSKEEAFRYLFEDSSRKYLLPYLKREINWIIVSILSTSYVSSLILMRSVFELIIGIATKSTESMSNRIDSIAFLNNEEKSELKKQWYRLCAWGHPYGIWIKEVCPIYANHKPLYHPGLCVLCLQELVELIDLLAAVVVTKYEIKPSQFLATAHELKIDLNDFKLLAAQMSV